MEKGIETLVVDSHSIWLHLGLESLAAMVEVDQATSRALAM